MLRELDVSVVHLSPDDWLLCSEECRLGWAGRWLAAHLRDALRCARPRPHAVRSALAHAGGGVQSGEGVRAHALLQRVRGARLPVCGAAASIMQREQRVPGGRRTAADASGKTRRLHAGWTGLGHNNGSANTHLRPSSRPVACVHEHRAQKPLLVAGLGGGAASSSSASPGYQGALLAAVYAQLEAAAASGLPVAGEQA